MKALISKYLAPAAALLAVTLFVGWCAERDGRIRAEAIAEKAREDWTQAFAGWRQSRGGLLLELARRRGREDSLEAAVVAHRASARRFRVERDSYAIRMALLLPDTGEARSTFERFAEACAAEASELEAALGACEAAGLSKDTSIAELTGQVAQADSLLTEANEGWEAAEKRASTGFFRRLVQAQPYALVEAAIVAILVAVSK